MITLTITEKEDSNEDNVNYDRVFWSDQMILADIDKYNKTAQKHFGSNGHWLDGIKDKDLELFLRDYYKNERLILVKVEKRKHIPTAFPCWAFYCLWNNSS